MSDLTEIGAVDCPSRFSGGPSLTVRLYAAADDARCPVVLVLATGRAYLQTSLSPAQALELADACCTAVAAIGERKVRLDPAGQSCSNNRAIATAQLVPLRFNAAPLHVKFSRSQSGGALPVLLSFETGLASMHIELSAQTLERLTDVACAAANAAHAPTGAAA